MKRNNLDEEQAAIHIGKRIRLRRTMLGWSQQKLAEALKITFQQVQKYESGANSITAVRLLSVAQKLKIGVEFFYEGLPGHSKENDDNDNNNDLGTRSNLEAMRSLQLLPKTVRHAVVNLIHCLKPSDKNEETNQSNGE